MYNILITNKPALMCTDFRVVYRAAVDVNCNCYWSSPAAVAEVGLYMEFVANHSLRD